MPASDSGAISPFGSVNMNVRPWLIVMFGGPTLISAAIRCLQSPCHALRAQNTLLPPREGTVRNVPTSSSQSAWAWGGEASACPASLCVCMVPCASGLSGPPDNCAPDRRVRGEAYTHVTPREALLTVAAPTRRGCCAGHRAMPCTRRRARHCVLCQRRQRLHDRHV